MNSLKVKGYKLSYRMELDTNPRYPLGKEFYLSALWGSASVLLTEKDLDIIVKVMESNK